MKIMTFSRILAGTMLLLVATGGAAAADPKRILLIHSFAQDFSPWREYEYHIRAELRRQLPEPLEIFEASLATARLADKTLDDVFAQYLGALSARYKLDLVVTIGAPAANFFLKVRQQIFPTVPMIFTGVEQRRVSLSDLTTNDAVVPSTVDHAGIIDHILRLLPATDHVAVVIGNSPNEKFWVESISNELKPFTGRVTFTWLNELPFEDMLKRAAALPPRSVILFIYVSVDAAGVSYEGKNVVNRLHAVANAPIFSWIDVDFGQGIVGGPLVPLVEVASQVARVADRILRGEVPSKIGIQPVGFGTPKYDWRELRRWDISESRLPPGSEIHFRNLTAWEQYRTWILLIIAALIAQAALIGWLIYEQRRRRKAEIESRQRLSELAHMNRHATAGELSASIAHELNQPLGAILNNTEIAELVLNSPSPNLEDIKEILAEIKRDDQRASEVIKRLRSLLTKAKVLHEDIDLNDTVREVLGFLSAQASSRDVVLPSALSPQVVRVKGDRIQLQQVILNLVVNGMDAMADASTGERKITSSTVVVDGAAEVSISDCGPGIQPDKLPHLFEPFFTTKEHGMGMGLSIARTIIEAHGGRIWAENQAGGGAIFRLSLPLAKAH